MSFKAKFRGKCGNEDCEDGIQVGDEVTYEEDVLVHVRCIYLVSVPSGIPVCPDCHLEHRGECF